jgi:hypothetical protein
MQGHNGGAWPSFATTKPERPSASVIRPLCIHTLDVCPPPKGYIAICSTSPWYGHIKAFSQDTKHISASTTSIIVGRFLFGTQEWLNCVRDVDWCFARISAICFWLVEITESIDVEAVGCAVSLCKSQLSCDLSCSQPSSASECQNSPYASCMNSLHSNPRLCKYYEIILSCLARELLSPASHCSFAFSDVLAG